MFTRGQHFRRLAVLTCLVMCWQSFATALCPCHSLNPRHSATDSCCAVSSRSDEVAAGNCKHCATKASPGKKSIVRNLPRPAPASSPCFCQCDTDYALPPTAATYAVQWDGVADYVAASFSIRALVESAESCSFEPSIPVACSATRSCRLQV